MRRINDILTVYTSEEIRKIVSDLIGKDAYKDFDAQKYREIDPLIIFAQYRPKEKKVLVIYRLNTKSKILPRYETREFNLNNGEWEGATHYPTSFDRVDLCDEWLKECEEIIKLKGDKAFIYISDFIINSSSIYKRCEGTFI